MVTIKIIIGSTRPNRFGPQVAKWLMEVAKDQPGATFELIDLKEVNLPFLDEPELPMMGNYKQDHTKKWSKMIENGDGYVWVHPEYNHGLNAELKNALDFLWSEWNDKPVALAGYGSNAGSSRAAEQLRLVASGLRMFDIRAELLVVDYRNHMEDGKFAPKDFHLKMAKDMLRDLVFWAEQLKRARAELAQLPK